MGGLRLNNNNLHVGFPVVIPYLPYKLVFGDPLHIPYKLVFDYIIVLLTFLIGLLLLSHIFWWPIVWSILLSVMACFWWPVCWMLNSLRWPMIYSILTYTIFPVVTHNMLNIGLLVFSHSILYTGLLVITNNTSKISLHVIAHCSMHFWLAEKYKT